MRKIVVSIFLVTVLALTSQSFASAKKIKHSQSNESTRYEITTTTNVDKVNGRNDEMMMNMSDAVGHNKGKDDALDNMFKIFMMCKTFISTALMFVDPIFKAKNFGLSLITTLLAVAKFIMDLKNSKSPEKKEVWGGSGLVSEEDRIGMAYGTAYRPTYLAHYPTYVHKYRMPVTS